MTQGERIRLARQSAGLTVAQLEECASISSLQAIEAGRTTCSAAMLENIARVLGVPADWIRTGNGRPRLGLPPVDLDIVLIMEAIQVAERTINDLLIARSMAPEEWARRRSDLLKPWARSLMRLHAAGVCQRHENAQPDSPPRTNDMTAA